MYQPSHFREERLEVQHGLIQAHPLGLLISTGADGLTANPIPFVLDPGPDLGILRMHIARANPQWQTLQGGAECLAVFQGPQSYVTPSWYETKRQTGKVVPTWNYATVHAWGTPRVVEDADWLGRQIDDLTRQMEEQRAAPWAVGDAPSAYIAMQVRGIVGIEIPIARIEGKWKMSQNRPEADRQGVIAGYRAAGESEMAASVEGVKGKPV